MLPEEHEPETSALVDILELEVLELDNVGIKLTNKLALPRANISAMSDVSI